MAVYLWVFEAGGIDDESGLLAVRKFTFRPTSFEVFTPLQVSILGTFSLLPGPIVRTAENSPMSP